MTHGWTAWCQAHSKAVQVSLKELCRHPINSVLSWLVIAIALTLPGLLILVLNNVEQLEQHWHGMQPTASVYLYPQAPDKQAQLVHHISAMSAVEAVDTITPAVGLQRLASATQLPNLAQILPKNPLPTVLVVRPTRSAVSSVALQALKQKIATQQGVQFVQLDLGWVKRLLAFLIIAQRFALFVALILGFGVLLVVGHTIRMGLLRYRQEINLLSLLGASAGFIRRPFLYRGWWLGMGGGLLASLALLVAQGELSGPVAQMAILYASAFRLATFSVWAWPLLILGSGVLGMLGALLACWRLKPNADIFSA